MENPQLPARPNDHQPWNRPFGWVNGVEACSLLSFRLPARCLCGASLLLAPQSSFMRPPVRPGGNPFLPRTECMLQQAPETLQGQFTVLPLAA